MTAHDHRVYVEGCYRCELSLDEVDPRFDVEPDECEHELKNGRIGSFCTKCGLMWDKKI